MKGRAQPKTVASMWDRNGHGSVKGGVLVTFLILARVSHVMHHLEGKGGGTEWDGGVSRHT